MKELTQPRWVKYGFFIFLLLIFTQRHQGDNLQVVNPDDIESMMILKGSTASALYGSRAAAGAIIITTKSGLKNLGIAVEYTFSYTARNIG